MKIFRETDFGDKEMAAWLGRPIISLYSRNFLKFSKIFNQCRDHIENRISDSENCEKLRKVKPHNIFYNLINLILSLAAKTQKTLRKGEAPKRKTRQILCLEKCLEKALVFLFLEKVPKKKKALVL